MVTQHPFWSRELHAVLMEGAGLCISFVIFHATKRLTSNKRLSLLQVFLIEYTGPLFIYFVFYLRMPFIYGQDDRFTSGRHPVVKWVSLLNWRCLFWGITALCQMSCPICLFSFLKCFYLAVSSLACICHSFHYIKRLIETIFVHRFSHGTMPLRNIVKVNCHKIYLQPLNAI